MTAWVPITTSAMPPPIASWISRLRFAVRDPERNSERTPSPSSSGASPAWCCRARISVGAISAPCHPARTAEASATAATAVLPLPTSPWRRRRIGRSEARSAVIASTAADWSPVRVNGSAPMISARSASVTRMAGAWRSSRALRACARPSWRARSSSNARRSSAGVVSASVSGKWAVWSASARGGRSPRSASVRGSSSEGNVASRIRASSSRSRFCVMLPERW